MNTNKLYIGKLNKVKRVIRYEKNNKSEIDCDIQINSMFSRFVLVRQNKYGYKDVITGEKYNNYSVLLKKDDVFVDDDYLVPFNDMYKNEKKYLSRKKVLSKFKM